MTKKPLLITEHHIVTVSRTDKTVLGQVRRRQNVARKNGVDYWEARTAASPVWYGRFASQDEAETTLQKGA